MHSDTHTPDTLRALNKKQLASQMGISESSLRRLLKKANVTLERGLISPARQAEIFQTLGWREMTRNDAFWKFDSAELCAADAAYGHRGRTSR